MHYIYILSYSITINDLLWVVLKISHHTENIQARVLIDLFKDFLLNLETNSECWRQNLKNDLQSLWYRYTCLRSLSGKNVLQLLKSLMWLNALAEWNNLIYNIARDSLNSTKATIKGINTLLGETTVKMFCLPSGKGIYSKRKEFAPRGSKFFHFRVEPFSEGGWWAGKDNRKSQKLSPFWKWRKSTRCI